MHTFVFFSSLYLNNTSFREDIDQTIITMRTDTNELNIHSLLADDIDRLRETGKAERKIFFFLNEIFYLKSLIKIIKND